MELDQKYGEDELIHLLRKQDQEALAYLYDRYAPALNGIIFRLVQDKVLADDILEEAFIKIWNNFSGYDKLKGSLFTWMINIAKDLTRDTLHSKGYKKQSKIFAEENSVSKMQDTLFGTDRFDSTGIQDE